MKAIYNKFTSAMRTALGLGAIVKLSVFAMGSHAASLNSSIDVTYQNGSSQYEFQPLSTVTDTSLNSVNTSFNTVNATYGTMVYGVAATAQSSYGGLHASFNTSVRNAFYNGVLTWLSGQSDAEFKDQLTIAGAPSLYSIQLVIQMDGSLGQTAGTYPYSVGSAALWYNLNNTPNSATTIISGSYIRTSPGGTINQTVTTAPFVLDANGQTYVDILLQAYSEWGLQYLTTGGNDSSTIDFSNTATVVGVEGFDSSGNQVTVNSVMGQSGTQYPLATVPEPTSCALVLMGLGLFGLAARCRP